MKTARNKRQRGIGKERVKAWIYAVINPLLDGLRTELHFLRDKNWTFSSDQQDLQFIKPLETYVEHFTFPNFEDFMESNPKVEAAVAKHDELRDVLLERCEAAFNLLIDSSAFQEKFDSCHRDVSLIGSSKYLTEADRERLRKAAREYIVNNRRELPAHYGDSDFWSRFGSEFLALRSGKLFQSLDRAGLDLEKHDERLSEMLRKRRSDLAEQYDVPHAPYYEPAARER